MSAVENHGLACHRPSSLVPTAGVCIAALFLATGALANVTISSQATQNMSCSNGVCAPTATKAVLNAGDLETLLASGSVSVVTAGQGLQAKDIDVKAAVAWSSGSVLTLDAYRSIAINQPVSITGLAGLALATDDGGNNGVLSFGPKGNVTFANLLSSLSINGAAYTLVGDIKTLAADIAANPSGNFALAIPYDASQDGTYASAPIPTTFTGSFEGLGNAIYNFSLDDEDHKVEYNGFFAELGANGSIADFGLSNVNIISRVGIFYMGTLVGWNLGTITGAYATGPITAQKTNVLGGLVGTNEGIISASFTTGNVTGSGEDGGLVGYNIGAINNSFATGNVSGGSAGAGGLVGLSEGSIVQSYATGNVRVKGRSGERAGGGLAGAATGSINDCYATGNVQGEIISALGGLIGISDAVISSSYSTGSPSNGEYIGGLIGYDEASSGSLTDTYWDTDSSGVTNLSQGAGNIANDPDITGLTTAQFRSGLPGGFDPNTWGESANINDGLPYLLANPPHRKKR